MTTPRGETTDIIRARAERDGYARMRKKDQAAWRMAIRAELGCHRQTVHSALAPPKAMGRPREHNDDDYCPICASHLTNSKKERVRKAMSDFFENPQNQKVLKELAKR